MWGSTTTSSSGSATRSPRAHNLVTFKSHHEALDGWQAELIQTNLSADQEQALREVFA